MHGDAYYLTHRRFGIRRWIKLDYSRPEHYRVVHLQENASRYHDREVAEGAIRFLGGEPEGFELFPYV